LAHPCNNALHDLNIALMNELAIIFDKMGIDSTNDTVHSISEENSVLLLLSNSKLLTQTQQALQSNLSSKNKE
jgi:hypothetical protein